MIRRLAVSNFRSLGPGIDLELGKLVALVGPNGSGKTNTADVIRFVADSLRIGLRGAVTQWHGIDSIRRWSGGRPFDVSITLHLDLPGSGTAIYGFVLGGSKKAEYEVKEEAAQIETVEGTFSYIIEKGRWILGPEGLKPPVDRQNLALQLVGGDPRFSPLVEALRSMEVYSIFPDTLRELQVYDPAKPMSRHGGNWASILRDQPESTWKPDLAEILGRLTGDLEDIEVKAVGGHLVAKFRHGAPDLKRPKWFDAHQESDGTLRVAGIVTALLQQPALPLVGIEEPELTVHPGALDLLVDYLREASQRSQVLITSHSPDLLDRLRSDEVLTVFRSEGVTKVEPMDSADRSLIRRGLMSLGDVLRNAEPPSWSQRSLGPAA